MATEYRSHRYFGHAITPIDGRAGTLAQLEYAERLEAREERDGMSGNLKVNKPLLVWTMAMAALALSLTGCLRSTGQGNAVTVIAPLSIPTNPPNTPQLTIEAQPTRPLPVLGTAQAGDSVSYITPAAPLGPITLPPITTTPTPYLSPTPAPTIPPTPPSPGDRCSYTVRAGDSLFAIALAYDTTVGEILANNPILEDEDIFPDDVLWIPDCDPNLSAEEQTATAIASTPGLPSATPTLAASIAARHTVISGENLFRIAQYYGVSMDAIISLNELENPDALSVGDVLLIPAPASE